MSPVPHVERINEAYDDYGSFREDLNKSTRRAQEMITRYQSGSELTDLERTELPHLLRSLRRLIRVQLDANSRLVREDLADGSRDDLESVELLRVQMGTVRNMHYDLNTMWGTRTVRKIGGFFEDVNNWFGTKWAKVKDNLWQVGRGIGMAAVPVASGLAWWNFGPLAGIATGAAGGYLYNRIFGTGDPDPRLRMA